MSTLRKLEREVIKNKCYKRNHNTKSFKHEWEKFHYGVEENNEEVKAVKKSTKRKQKHFDDGKAYIKHLKAVKSFIDGMKNKTPKTNAREKVC